MTVRPSTTIVAGGAVAVDAMPPSQGGIIRGLLARAEIDRAVLYGVSSSVWQVVAAPVTILVLARCLTPAAQGYYYTFNSLLALQTYAELGLSIVVLNVASHEWANLSLDADGRIVGGASALSRLVSLGRFVFAWYLAAAVLFLIGVGVVGAWLLSSQTSGESWRGPWWTLIAVTSLQLWMVPFNALLEGCNQVTNIQKLRLSQGILRSVAIWSVLAFGGSLWAAVAAAKVAVVRDAYLLGVTYRRFFGRFLAPPAGPSVSWRIEIWPMQWRLALSGIVSYFLLQAFVPVMFWYHGAVTAGRMGMTLSVVAVIQGVAGMWLQPKVPRFGMLIARKEFATLDAVWRRVTTAVVIVAGAAASAAWIVVWVLNVFDVPLATRLLPPKPTGILLIGAVFMAFGYCQTAYLRAHKREPLLPLSVVTSLLMGALVWMLGSRFGPVGAAAAYLIVIVGVSVPWETGIWLRSRLVWHAS